MSTAPAPIEQQTQSYIDIQYLAAFGLFKANCLEYFYTSPFFDQNSNNQRLRVQGLHPDQHLSVLQTMTGLEYVLDEHNTCEPNLFVFRKQNRWSPKRADLIDVYYCTDGIIYQCPDFLNLLKSRVAKTSFYLGRSFETCLQGVGWVDAASESAAAAAAAAGVGLGAGRKRKSGFVCWQPEAGAVAGACGKPAAEGEASSTPTTAAAVADPFLTRERARGKAVRKYDRLVRDLPSFKSVLGDVQP